ncbi:DUF2628 domain-containing protein [Hyphomicrobium sp.]|uniref:DUF2628 domain-containing protein n=1 Tax=Hyphomicrobium sp. TaxID=82 RepID=UPI003F6EAAE6
MLGALIARPSRMAAYTVHEPREKPASKEELAENLVFIRDGFSWLAAIFGPLYLLFRGEWRALALYLVIATVLGAALQALGARPDWIGWAMLLLNIVVGLEMSELRRWSLSRAGWREIATVNGAGEDEAERRFFESWLPSATVASSGHDGAIPSPRNTRDDTASRVQRSLDGLSARLRSKFALKH